MNAKRRYIAMVLGMLFILLGSSPLAVEAQTTSSYLQYQPRTEDFESRLQPIVVPLTKALRQDGDLQKPGLEESISAGEKLISVVPRGLHDEIYFLRGFAQENLGLLEEALTSYNRSLQLKTSDDLVLFRKAFVLKNLDRCSEAIPRLEEVAWRAKAARHEVLYLQARCNLDLQDKVKAFQLAQTAFREHVTFLPVLKLLVQLRQEQLTTILNPAERAPIEAQLAAELNQIVLQDPGDRNSTVLLVRLLIRQVDPLVGAQRLQEAEGLANRLASKSNFKDDESVKLLFDVQLKRGNLPAAEKTLKTGLQQNPGSALLAQAGQQLAIERGLEEMDLGSAS